MEYRGLTEKEIAESRAKHGENFIPEPPEKPLWRQYLEKFNDPLIIILLVAGALSIGIACYQYYGLSEGAAVFFEPSGIFMAILLATGLGFFFELKANKEFKLLNTSRDYEMVTVIRDGKTVSVPRKDVVVEDILVLSTGDEIPADAKLLESMSLVVDESSLTGELSCNKSADPAEKDEEATFPTDMVLRGTRILEGHGIAEVTAVGVATENGKVFTAAQIDDSVRTPLNEQLDGLGDMITKVSYALAGLIIVGRFIVYFVGDNPTDIVSVVAYGLQSLMIAVTLVVVAVPEGLPMAVTLSLAYSMRRMLKTGNLARKMHACETMGACTVICSDKTGTLTKNQMTVSEFFFFSEGNTAEKSARQQRVNENIALNSTARIEDGKVYGNPTEGALLLWLGPEAMKRERESAVIEAEIPFSTQKKYMAVQAKLPDGKRRIFIKGAPEIIMELSVCDKSAIVKQKLIEWQSRGMRTLAFASIALQDDAAGIVDGELPDCKAELDGIVSILDPVRDDVPDAIAACRRAGIDVKMVTGDTQLTATDIARQSGLLKEGAKIVTGPEIAAMSDEELAAQAKDIGIIARARPMDKERFVRALQANNEVVAVTGDGTNDAPALNAAHVGLSMGSGTSVAKEASDITILDDSFASIGRAVMWGRSLYANIQRFILFQLTVNVAACLTVLAGAFMGTQSPLTVTQMLWINLIMDTFAAMALASLPPRPDVMNKKPRKREDFIISPAMRKNIIIVGGLFFVLMTWFAWFLEHYDVVSLLDIENAARKEHVGLSYYEESLFFTVFVMLQWWNLFNAKAWQTGQSAFHFKGCNAFLGIVVLIFTGQVLITCFGGRFFNVSPISLADWLVIIAATSPVLLIGEWMRGIMNIPETRDTIEIHKAFMEYGKKQRKE